MMDADSYDPDDSETERTMAADMDAEGLLAAASGRTRSVWVCPDAALLSAYNAKLAELDAVQRENGKASRTQMLVPDDGDLEGLRDEVAELAGQVDAKLIEVKLEEVKPSRVRELRADHYVSRDQAKRQNRKAGELDVDAFLEALTAESMVSPKPTADNLDRLLNTTNEMRLPVLSAVDELHGQGADPKAQVATGRRLSGGSS